MIDKLRRVTFLTGGVLPVPAVEGGAVEALIQVLLDENEKKGIFDFHVISIWSEEANRVADKYLHASFTLIRIPLIIQHIDRSIFSISKHLFHKRNASAYRFIAQRLWFIWCEAKVLAKQNCGTLIVENHPSIFLALKLCGNDARYAGNYYYHLHNVFSELYSCKGIAKRVKSVLSVSEFVQNSYDYLLEGLRDEQKIVFRNCVDYELFSKGFTREEIIAFRDKYGLAQTDFVFMFSGRITPEKGVRELLKAFGGKAKEMPNARLLIIGGAFFGSDVGSDYEAEVKLLGGNLGNRVVFTGFLNHEDMPLACAASDVCCLPSMWEEPACLSVLEGMAAGKPVITTRSGGIPEYTLDDGAILLDKGDGFVDRLGLAMVELYADAKLRASLGLLAKTRASKFDSDSYLERFAVCIEESMQE